MVLGYFISELMFTVGFRLCNLIFNLICDTFICECTQKRHIRLRQSKEFHNVMTKSFNLMLDRFNGIHFKFLGFLKGYKSFRLNNLLFV